MGDTVNKLLQEAAFLLFWSALYSVVLLVVFGFVERRCYQDKPIVRFVRIER